MICLYVFICFVFTLVSLGISLHVLALA